MQNTSFPLVFLLQKIMDYVISVSLLPSGGSLALSLCPKSDDDLVDKELSVTEYLSLAGMPQAAVSVDGLMEMLNSRHIAFYFDIEDREHCLQENIPVVTVRDGEEAAFFEIPVGAIERARNTEFRGYEPEEMAVSIEDRFISIQKVEDGYDYTIYNADYKELDGGVYDNSDISIQNALDEIVVDLKGEYQEGIKSIQDAIAVWEQIPPERLHGIPAKVNLSI